MRYLSDPLVRREMMEELRCQYRNVLGSERGESAFTDAVERSKRSLGDPYDFVKHALMFGDYTVGVVPIKGAKSGKMVRGDNSPSR